MSESEVQVVYTFLWFSVPPSCPECTALNGTVIHGQTLDQPILYDPATGKPIWDLNSDRPLTHGGTGKNCDCRLEVIAEADLSKEAWLQDLYAETQKLI